MDLSGFVKRLQVPPGSVVPRQLVHEGVRARAIDRGDLADDVSGINSSLEVIRRTRGGGWPTEPVSEDFNYVDLVWHEAEFRDLHSFTYVVRDRNDRYLGCCYLYPMGGRTPLTEELLAHDVDVSWWVTAAAYEAGYYEKVYVALRRWLADDFPFTAPYFSNREIPSETP
jgi:hypothetical protein